MDIRSSNGINRPSTTQTPRSQPGVAGNPALPQRLDLNPRSVALGDRNDTQTLAGTPEAALVSFGLDEDEPASPLADKSQHLRAVIDMAASEASPPLSETERVALQCACDELNRVVQTPLDTREKRQAFQQALRNLSGELKSHHLMRGSVRRAFHQVINESIRRMGYQAGITAEVIQNQGVPLGISAPTDLTPSQQAMMLEMNDLMRFNMNLAITPGPLTPQKMLIMGLKEEIIKLAYESQLAPAYETPSNPTLLEDRQILINTAGLLDDLMAVSDTIPANLLEDLTQLVDSAKKQGGAGLQQAFETLTEIGTQTGQLGQEVDAATANLQSLLDTVTTLDAPNMVDSANTILTDYISASNSISSTLPTLPFPITLPTPINIALPGGGNVTVPAGSTLSWNSSTGYTLNTNGFTMNSSGTNIVSGNGTIILGNSTDQLSFDTMDFTQGSTHVGMTGFNAQVDKVSNSSQITADTIQVDMSSGQVSMTQARITQDPNNLTLRANNFNYTGTSGDSLAADQVRFGQNVDDTTGIITTNGNLQGVDANMADGTVIAADRLNFTIVDDPTGADTLQMTGQNISVQSGADQITMGTASLNVTTNPDGSSVTTFATQNGTWANGDQAVTSSAVGFEITQGTDGNIDTISALADDLNYTNGSDAVQVTNGALTLDYGDNGQISQISTTLGQVDWANDNQWATATDVSGQANYDPSGNLEQVQLNAGQVIYGNEKGTLQVDGGSLALNYDENGALENANFAGDSINYTSLDGQGKPFNVNVGTFSGQLTPNEAGGQTLNVTAQNVETTMDNTTVTVDNIQSFEVITNANGQVESFNLDAPGVSTIQTDELQATLNNVNVNYSQEVLSATADSLQGNLTQPKGFTGQFTADGLQLWDTEAYTSVHLESISGDFRKLGAHYGLNVDNVDLVLNKGELGQLTDGELRFGDLAGNIKGYTLTGTNEEGRQMVMSFSMSDDGEWLQNLALEIPEGGTLSVNKGKDWFLTLGEQQTFEMTFEQESNMFTFNAHNFNAQYGTKNMTVDVSGLRGNPAELQISVTQDGGIVIDNISNVHGEITLKGVNGLKPITINIDEIKGFSTNNLTMDTNNNGMSLHLKPDGPDSVITAEVRTSYHGIPVGISFDNVHELEAGYVLETNHANVYIGDPSGRGQIEIQAGPLRLKGSEIQVDARYHPYDPQRMLNALDKLMSDNDIRVLGDYVTLDPVRGKLTLDTGNERGPYLQTNFMFASPIRSAMSEIGLPGGIRDDAFGFTVGLGARWTSDVGTTRHQLGIDAGLLPGSYVSIDVQKGQASFANIPLPDHMTIGATPYAGLNYRQEGIDYRFSAMMGAFSNPVGLVQSPLLEENEQYTWGTFGGFRYHNSDATFVGMQYVATGSNWDNFANTDPQASQWNHTVTTNAGFQW